MNKVAAQRLEAQRQLGALRQVPAALDPIAGREAQAQHAIKGLAHGGKQFEHKTGAVVKAASVGVAALVRYRRQKLVQQIAVGGMQLHRLDTHAMRAPGSQHKGLANFGHRRQAQLGRGRLTGQLRQRRRAHWHPAARFCAEQLAALPRPGTGGFAPCMG